MVSEVSNLTKGTTLRKIKVYTLKLLSIDFIKLELYTNGPMMGLDLELRTILSIQNIEKKGS